MTKLKAKVELLNRITALGFTFDEAQQLRRISMTLRKWAEDECNGDIQRSEETGKPARYLRTGPSNSRYHAVPIADREAGALKRLKAIIDARNARAIPVFGPSLHEDFKVHAHHQTDPRGCSLYLLSGHDLPKVSDEEMRRHSGEWPLKSEETRLQWKLSCYYTRGLAVCA